MAWPKKQPPFFGRQPVADVLARLEEAENDNPELAIWGRYLRRFIRLYARSGTVDLSEQGLAAATRTDRIVVGDALRQLETYLTFTNN
jgi:hypothetical protein